MIQVSDFFLGHGSIFGALWGLKFECRKGVKMGWERVEKLNQMVFN